MDILELARRKARALNTATQPLKTGALMKPQQATAEDSAPPPHWPPRPPCRVCQGRDFWVSRHGNVVCRFCHPPAPGAELPLRKEVRPHSCRPPTLANIERPTP